MWAAGSSSIRALRSGPGFSSYLRPAHATTLRPLFTSPSHRNQGGSNTSTSTRGSTSSSSEGTSSSDPSLTVEGSTDISHSSFISSASASSDFNPLQTPQAGQTAASPWQGHLSPTKSHLLKLILPLPASKSNFEWRPDPSQSNTSPQPTAFLLHPSQPLSHLSRLIAGSLPVRFRDCELEYLALTGQEDDLDTHLRNAEEEGQGEEGEEGRQEGGPHLKERRKSMGRYQEVSWSQATDLADFVKQSCLNEKFKIVITPRSIDGKPVEGESGMGMALEVMIPSFASRTTYLRKRLLELTQSLDQMTKKKKTIDTTAHKGAQRLFVAGLSVGAAYWIAVIRWTFFTDAGWDVMEPVTWTTGYGMLLMSCAFLVYHNREVSYSSLLDLSVSARQQRLYEQHGLNIEHWTESVAEAKTLRKEIARIAADYDIEWKGELENLANEKLEGGLAERIREADMRGGTGAARKSDKSHREGSSETPSSSSSSSSTITSSSTVSSNSNTNSIASTSAPSKTPPSSPKVETGKGKDNHLDIDATIDEASELAEQTTLQREKERAAARKGEVVEDDEAEGRGVGSKARKRSLEEGRERGMKEVGRNHQRFE